MWFADFLFVTLAKNGAVWLVLLSKKRLRCTALHIEFGILIGSFTPLGQLNYYSSHSSCVEVCLSMHSGCFHSAHFWWGDLHPLISETHTHKSPRKTYAAVQRAEDVFSKKTGSWSNWFNRVLMMFVCPRNLFHILNLNSASAVLNVSVMDISEVGGILSHKHLVSLKTVFLAQGYDWYDVSKAIFRFDDTAVPFQHTPWDIMRSKPLSFVVWRNANLLTQWWSLICINFTL